MDGAVFLSQLAVPERPSLDAHSVAVIVAHQDDETIGIGAQLARLKGVWIVHVTDGSPRHALTSRAGAAAAEWRDYAQARRQEVEAAMALAGIAPEQILCLGVADQQAARNLRDVTSRIAGWVRAKKITTILTHPYEGGHPDHDATAFAVQAACHRIEQMGDRPPAVIEMASYHGYGWTFRRSHFIVQRFLPDSVIPVLCRSETSDIVTLRLGAAERAAKQRMFDCFATQYSTMDRFRPRLERFRLAPRYDFTRPPHPGRLLYDRRDWGMSSMEWRALAVAALKGVLVPV